MRAFAENEMSTSWNTANPVGGEIASDRCEAGDTIRLQQIDGRMTHVLEGRVVENGDRIELLLDDGRWIGGEYYWSGATARWPGLRIILGQPRKDSAAAGGERTSPTQAVLALHPDAVLRWAGH